LQTIITRSTPLPPLSTNSQYHRPGPQGGVDEPGELLPLANALAEASKTEEMMKAFTRFLLQCLLD
jgi:hypothetical protein